MSFPGQMIKYCRFQCRQVITHSGSEMMNFYVFANSFKIIVGFSLSPHLQLTHARNYQIRLLGGGPR
jgi:hypothetical protein